MSPIFVDPQDVDKFEDCFFYHSVDIPGHGYVEGLSDMRPAVPVLFDTVDLKNAKVVEVGPASGFLSFEMEKRGADVVSVELGPQDEWSLVRHASMEADDVLTNSRGHLDKLRNGYWFAHKRQQSKAKLVHGSCYNLQELGVSGEVGLISNLLVHLRDPLRAVESMANAVSKTIIICDAEPYMESRKATPIRLLSRWLPIAQFMPKSDDPSNSHTWWHLSPILVKQFVKILGFTDVQIKYFKSGLYPGVMHQWAVIANRPS